MLEEEKVEEVEESLELDDSLEEFHDYEEDTKPYRKKINRQLKIVVIATIITLLARKFHKYGDFDIVQRSPLFITLLVLSLLFTAGVIYYLYSIRNEFLDEKIHKTIRRLLDIFDMVSVIPVFLAVMSILNIFMISPASVIGASMEPNYHEGDDILIWHLYPDYERYDVLVIRINEEEYYIKRIIGLPGDRILIDENEIYINDELLDQKFLEDEDGSMINYTYCDTVYTRTCEFRVPIDSYFVLGDNRENSLDSRFPIDDREAWYFKEEDIMGKVVFHFNNIFK